MRHGGECFSGRRTIFCASILCAIFASAPSLAQRRPIVIEPDSNLNLAVSGPKALATINKSGSYVMNRNLIDNKANFNAVNVTASNVTISLEGFSIIGSSSTGIGINANGKTNVVIVGGTITGMGGAAIVTGSDATISSITASGDSAGVGATGATIQAGNASRVSGNTVTGGGTGGISCGVGCLVQDNLIQANTGVGLVLGDPSSGYSGNVMQGNDANTVGSAGQVSGGSAIGLNLCNGATC